MRLGHGLHAMPGRLSRMIRRHRQQGIFTTSRPRARGRSQYPGQENEGRSEQPPNPGGWREGIHSAMHLIYHKHHPIRSFRVHPGQK
jgi:hypothetical protein